MSDLFNNEKINLKEWSIDELYNEWTIINNTVFLGYFINYTHSDLQRCICDRKFSFKNQADINEYRNKIEYELQLKGFDWSVS